MSNLFAYIYTWCWHFVYNSDDAKKLQRPNQPTQNLNELLVDIDFEPDTRMNSNYQINQSDYPTNQTASHTQPMAQSGIPIPSWVTSPLQLVLYPVIPMFEKVRDLLRYETTNSHTQPMANSNLLIPSLPPPAQPVEEPTFLNKHLLFLLIIFLCFQLAKYIIDILYVMFKIYVFFYILNVCYKFYIKSSRQQSSKDLKGEELVRVE
jgi:hypothetical protein